MFWCTCGAVVKAVALSIHIAQRVVGLNPKQDNYLCDLQTIVLIRVREWSLGKPRGTGLNPKRRRGLYILSVILFFILDCIKRYNRDTRIRPSIIMV